MWNHCYLIYEFQGLWWNKDLSAASFWRRASRSWEYCLSSRRAASERSSWDVISLVIRKRCSLACSSNLPIINRDGMEFKDHFISGVFELLNLIPQNMTVAFRIQETYSVFFLKVEIQSYSLRLFLGDTIWCAIVVQKHRTQCNED